MAERLPTYVIDGHGSESVCAETDRPIVPPGTVVISFTECGMPALVADTIVKLKSMETDPSLWNNFTAQSTKEEIKASLPKAAWVNTDTSMHSSLPKNRGPRVYTPGMFYPDLLLTSLGAGRVVVDNPDTEVNSRIYWKSGVYKLPITVKDYSAEWVDTKSGVKIHMPQNNDPGALDHIDRTAATYAQWNATKPEYEHYRNVKFAPIATARTKPELKKAYEAVRAKAAADSYEGAIFPDAATQATIVKDHMEDKKERPVRLSEIIDKFGPGIYYWIVCRSPAEQKVQVLEMRAISAARQRTARAGRRRGRKTYRKKRRVPLKVARR